MNALHLVGAASLVLAGAGCARGMSVQARVSDLAAVAREARDRGAYLCAPEELARAEAELEFARHELALGDPARADEHVTRAGANARAALRLSAEARCREVQPTMPEASLRAAPASPRLSLTQLRPRRWSTKEHAAT
jgi:OmpA-OmpF porin, OOP family